MEITVNLFKNANFLKRNFIGYSTLNAEFLSFYYNLLQLNKFILTSRRFEFAFRLPASIYFIFEIFIVKARNRQLKFN